MQNRENENNNIILEVKHLFVSFSQYERGLKRKKLTAIADLDLDVRQGEILAVVGSSGSGKSLLAHAVLGILPENASVSGEISYGGMVLNEEEKARIRGREISLIPQSVNYLDPLMKVGKQIEISIDKRDEEKDNEFSENEGMRKDFDPAENESLLKDRDTRGKKTARSQEKKRLVMELLGKYGLAPETYDSYPHMLSGGMARKVLLCTALAAESNLIIADEPTPGLDDRALNEVLKDFRELADSGKSILMITHDISAAMKIADRIAIFYAGTTLEVANSKDFAEGGEVLRHPYSKALLKALPTEDFAGMEGVQPLPQETQGCSFYDRCPLGDEACIQAIPQFRELRAGKVRCCHAE